LTVFAHAASIRGVNHYVLAALRLIPGIAALLIDDAAGVDRNTVSVSRGGRYPSANGHHDCRYYRSRREGVVPAVIAAVVIVMVVVMVIVMVIAIAIDVAVGVDVAVGIYVVDVVDVDVAVCIGVGDVAVCIGVVDAAVVGFAVDVVDAGAAYVIAPRVLPGVVDIGAIPTPATAGFACISA